MNWYFYHCNYCGKFIKRAGDVNVLKRDGTPKKWIRSWCEEKGVDARIQLVEGGEDGR